MKFRALSIVAVAAVIVTAVALLPGVGFGEAPVHHSSSPTDLYTVKDPGLCPMDRIPVFPGTNFTVMHFNVSQTSTVVVDWTMKWGWGRTPLGGADLYIIMFLEGEGFDESSPGDGFAWHSTPDHDTATVMWPFVDVPPGTYKLSISAIDLRTSLQESNPERSGGGVTIQGCAAAVAVSPNVV